MSSAEGHGSNRNIVEEDDDEEAILLSNSDRSSSPPSPLIMNPTTRSPPPITAHEEEQEARRRLSISYRVSISIGNPSSSTEAREDACSCFVVLATFWLFASMTLILGFYGSVDLHLGPNSSWLLQANSFFVQDIKVEATEEFSSTSKSGAHVYGFSKSPLLDIKTTWTEIHTLSLPANSHKEWTYYFNRGSQINVSYEVKTHTGSSPVVLVIAQGKESLLDWIDDPSSPNTTLSWNLIHGNGLVEQKTSKPSDYYIAVGNMNPPPVEVQLNFSIQASLYNTTGAIYECSLNRGLCVMKLTLFSPRSAVITTCGPETHYGANADWNVKLSYGPRWTTYFVGSGVITVVVLMAFHFITKLFCGANATDNNHQRPAEVANQRSTPLLTNKDDDDDLSLGSSYDSVSHDDEESEERLVVEAAAAAHHPELEELLERSNPPPPQRLCAVCFDAPKDSFFLPCGHCATCFGCGTRITEEAGNCPVCRRRTKKVRRIFTV